MIHYPGTAQARQELMKTAAEVHARAVIDRVRSVPCPAEQKLLLIDAIKTYIPK